MFEKRKESKELNEPDASDARSTSTSSAGPLPLSRSTAMIGKTIQVKGTITGSENLVIEGTVDGTVDLPQNDLTVGESGQVTADLVAKVVKVDGQVTGDISGNEKVVISKSGKVKGNIVAPRVTLEDGAKFKGSIDMDPGENVPAAVESPASVGKAASNIDAKSSR